MPSKKWQIGHFLKKTPPQKLLTYLPLILGHLQARKCWEIQGDIFFAWGGVFLSLAKKNVANTSKKNSNISIRKIVVFGHKPKPYLRGLFKNYFISSRGFDFPPFELFSQMQNLPWFTNNNDCLYLLSEFRMDLHIWIYLSYQL